MEKYFDGNKEVNLIVDWIKNYFVKNGPTCNAVIGISGGKDSSVVAALCVKALGADRVIGVKMPQGKQHDINAANDLINHLGIKAYEINIGGVCEELYQSIDAGYDYDHTVKNNSQITSNTPARIRMSVLYAIAAAVHGRVANTCNYSEDYVGYATKFGDAAGDFAPLQKYTVTEVRQLGKALGLPAHLINKIPEDGLSGKSDEDNLGFTYDILDNYLMNSILPDVDTLANIEDRHNRNIHKLNPMPVCNGTNFRARGWKDPVWTQSSFEF